MHSRRTSQTSPTATAPPQLCTSTATTTASARALCTHVEVYHIPQGQAVKAAPRVLTDLLSLRHRPPERASERTVLLQHLPRCVCVCVRRPLSLLGSANRSGKKSEGREQKERERESRGKCRRRKGNSRGGLILRERERGNIHTSRGTKLFFIFSLPFQGSISPSVRASESAPFFLPTVVFVCQASSQHKEESSQEGMEGG